MNIKKLILWLTLPLYVADQATKFWTIANFAEPPAGMHGSPDKWVIIDGWFEWVRVHNQGVAFGLGNGTAWAPLVFPFISLTALLLLRWAWKKNYFPGRVPMVAIALLLCGIFGNLTDRMIQGFLLKNYIDGSFWERLSQGYVVDFVLVKLPFYDKIVPSSGGWWPAFNVADSCICIAAVLLFLSGFKEEKKDKA